MFRSGDSGLQNGMAQDGIHILPRNALKRRPSDRKCALFHFNSEYYLTSVSISLKKTIICNFS